MSIKARVGRHARDGGRHCQNWPEDQRTVIDLLNAIPAAAGGAGGGLKPRVVSGVCSDELYRAILVFEGRYMPGPSDGFLDPDGGMLKRMEELTKPAGRSISSRPPTRPAAFSISTTGRRRNSRAGRTMW